jgi:hypothetical protein
LTYFFISTIKWDEKVWNKGNLSQLSMVSSK